MRYILLFVTESEDERMNVIHPNLSSRNRRPGHIKAIDPKGIIFTNIVLKRRGLLQQTFFMMKKMFIILITINAPKLNIVLLSY